jgi:hypothetical protein|tara:strand:+ start:187 stop:513 length:327 start_codon:yes stop_codon:yes gene_type:complete
MANRYKVSKVDLVNTDVTTLYTAPTATVTVIKSIVVSNDSSSQDTITVTITNGSSVFSLFKLYSVDALGTEELLKQPLIVDESEIIKVTAATANRLHVVMSYLEISRD